MKLYVFGYCGHLSLKTLKSIRKKSVVKKKIYIHIAPLLMTAESFNFGMAASTFVYFIYIMLLGIVNNLKKKSAENF